MIIYQGYFYFVMSYQCDITGKGKQFGHNVSHSQKKTQKVFKPNLQTKTLIIDGQKVRLKLATSTIRTLKKYQKQFELSEEKTKKEKEKNTSQKKPTNKTNTKAKPQSKKTTKSSKK